eukprot:682937-Amphidinium_carterae.1
MSRSATKTDAPSACGSATHPFTLQHFVTSLLHLRQCQPRRKRTHNSRSLPSGFAFAPFEVKASSMGAWENTQS